MPFPNGENGIAKKRFEKNVEKRFEKNCRKTENGRHKKNRKRK